MSEGFLTDSRVSLRGASGAEREFEVSRLAAAHDDAPAVYVLFGPDRQDGQPAVLHVAETEHLEEALAEHAAYPCLGSFVESVGCLPVGSAGDGAAIAADLASGLKPSCEGCWPPISEGDASDGRPYPHRVVGGCTTEQALLDFRLEQAIRENRTIRFVHGRDHVEAVPHQYGVTDQGIPALLAYRTSFGAGQGSLDPWQLFPLAEIHALVITDRTARGGRPAAQSPLEVVFTTSSGLEEASGDVAEVVTMLRGQVLEVLRMQARAARLRYRLDKYGGPAELSLALARVEADQARVAGEILALIPVVAGLQRAAAGDPDA